MTTHDHQPHYSLSELTDEAGVSVRTVRYYIAEGLLPPPIAAGPRSSYTQAHLDRLRLIDRMKASYFPLKEIRHRLNALDDQEIRRLAESETTPSPLAIQESPPQSPDSASSYIARLLHRPSPAAQAKPAAPPQVAMRSQHFVDDREPVSYAEPPGTVAPSTAAPSPTAEGSSWRRIPLTSDAELLIRDETYQRKRDRVEWLVAWARKVFG